MIIELELETAQQALDTAGFTTNSLRELAKSHDPLLHLAVFPMLEEQVRLENRLKLLVLAITERDGEK